MIRIALLLFTLAGTVVLTGCSYHADFVLVNESGKPVTVVYSLKVTEVLLPYPKRAFATIDQFNSDRRAYTELPDDRFHYDPDSELTTVKLNAGEVLFLTSIDIRGIKDERTFKSGMDRLTIKSESGAVIFEGDEVFPQFVPSSWAWFPDAYLLYTLTYE